MIKVIETNILMDKDEMKDFQSRIIEIDNWYDFIEEIKNGKTIIRKALLGNLFGNTIPRNSKIENFKFDDFHLSCDVYNYQGIKTKKLVYLIKEL